MAVKQGFTIVIAKCTRPSMEEIDEYSIRLAKMEKVYVRPDLEKSVVKMST